MFMKRNNVLIRVLSLAFFARKKGLKIAVAESCTSGLLADLLSSIAGSSAWFDFGVGSPLEDLLILLSLALDTLCTFKFKKQAS